MYPSGIAFASNGNDIFAAFLNFEPCGNKRYAAAVCVTLTIEALRGAISILRKAVADTSKSLATAPLTKVIENSFTENIVLFCDAIILENVEAVFSVFAIVFESIKFSIFISDLMILPKVLSETIDILSENLLASNTNSNWACFKLITVPPIVTFFVCDGKLTPLIYNLSLHLLSFKLDTKN